MEKDLSVAWQRAAFAEPDILPLYGSSELIKHFGNEPQRFFSAYPTGFAISPAGRGGCTSLNLAEKIGAAAVGGSPGRRVVICLSPSWFLHRDLHHRWYLGNFSPDQARMLIFRRDLSLDLKREFARRMLAYPDSLGHEPLLAFALRHLVGNAPMDAALFRAVEPVGRAGVALSGIRDHFAFAGHILFDRELRHVPARHAQVLDWEGILADENPAGAASSPEKVDEYPPRFSNDESFTQVITVAREWQDLELLLRLNRELHLEPLLLSIPIDYEYYRTAGVSAASLDLYTERLHALAQRYDVALIDFPEHRHDPSFFADHNDHLSARGWLYLDRALDFYYHAAPHQRYFAPVEANYQDWYP